MKKLLILPVFIITGVSVSFLSGCGSTEDVVDTTQTSEYANPNGYSTALVFHIQTTITDVENAMKTIDPTMLDSTIKAVEFASMTLTNAVKIAEDEGKPEVAQKLKELDDRLKAICKKEWLLAWEFTPEVETIVGLLKEIIK